MRITKQYKSAIRLMIAVDSLVYSKSCISALTFKFIKDYNCMITSYKLNILMGYLYETTKWINGGLETRDSQSISYSRVYYLFQNTFYRYSWSLSRHQLQMHQLELQILSILLVMGDIVPHPCITQDLGIIVFGLFQFGSFLINIWIYYALILKNMIINKIPFTALPIALKFQ